MVIMSIPITKLVQTSKVLGATFKRYKWKFSLIVIFGFLTGVSGAFGISTLIPIFYILTGQETIGFSFVTRTIQDVLAFLNLPFNLQTVLSLTALLFVIKGVIQFIVKYFNEKIYADYDNSIRARLFKQTMRASWPYLIDQKVGHLEKVLMRDTSAVSGAISQISSLILVSTSFIIYTFFAFNISRPITIITSLFGLFLLLAFRPFLSKLKRLHQEIRNTENTVAHFLSENIIGAKVIKTSAIEENVISQGEKYFKKYRNDHLRIAVYNNSIGSVFEPISFIFIAILMLFFYRSPSFEIASFVVIIYLIQKIFSFIQIGQSTIQSIITSIPYIQSLAQYKKEVVRHQELKDGKDFTFTDRIEFKDVTFSYRPSKEILSNINFVIRKGDMIGLIGPSGAGKTTIADLLMRLFSPTRGEILVDGINIGETNLLKWRKNIGYMPQDTFLMNDTIENNIRFYNDSITTEKIIKATQMANINEFIQELPEGLKTVIGERGVKVSAGQRQRIMLARALVHDPEIIIFDEATSALDNQSESMIQKTIENLRGRITILVIAHRLSTIMRSDRLLVLSNSTIIEEGSPDILLANKDSQFYKTYNIMSHHEES